MIQRIRMQVSSYKWVAVLSYMSLRYQIKPLHYFSNSVKRILLNPKRCEADSYERDTGVACGLRNAQIKDCHWLFHDDNVPSSWELRWIYFAGWIASKAALNRVELILVTHNLCYSFQWNLHPRRSFRNNHRGQSFLSLYKQTELGLFLHKARFRYEPNNVRRYRWLWNS